MLAAGRRGGPTTFKTVLFARQPDSYFLCLKGRNGKKRNILQRLNSSFVAAYKGAISSINGVVVVLKVKKSYGRLFQAIKVTCNKRRSEAF